VSVEMARYEDMSFGEFGREQEKVTSNLCDEGLENYVRRAFRDTESFEGMYIHNYVLSDRVESMRRRVIAERSKK